MLIMSYSNQEEKKEPQVLNVLPTTKGRRILTFLGDFFINFILSFIVFTAIVLPVGQKASNYWGRRDRVNESIYLRSEVLYGNKLLFQRESIDQTEMLYNASYTFYCFFSYYIFDEETPVTARDKQYGHKEENEIFRHYFVDIAHNHADYYRLFDLYNPNGKYFTKTGNVYTLNANVKEKIMYHVDNSDSPSGDGNALAGELEDNFFYPMYSEMMTSIENKTDLYWNGYTYNGLQSYIKGFESYTNTLAWITSLSALLLSTAVIYLAIPLLNKNHKTPTMMILRMERVSRENLEIAKKPVIVINFIYSYFVNLVSSFFIPTIFVTIYGVFNIPVLMVLGIFSLLLMFSSFIFLLFNKFNMDLFDYLTRSVLLKTDTLDDVYRAKGYYI